MPRRYEMSDLVLRCKQRCDLENDEHISDAEWKRLVSEQYGDLYSRVARSGLRYFETFSDFTADGSASYTEPAEHLGTVALFRVVNSAGMLAELRELMPWERAQYAGLTGTATRFELVDDKLYLYPKPNSGTYRMLYVQQPPDLSDYADDDIVDVVTPDGEAFLVWGTAVKALAKSEADVRLAMAERDACGQRLEEWAVLRAMTEPRRGNVMDADSPWISPGDWRFR